jgi:hypothetical protein
MLAGSHARFRLTGPIFARAVGAGAALGVAARLVDEIAPRWTGNLGATWFVAAFLAGGLESRPRLGARAGALCLSVATVAYYALRLAIDPIALRQVVPIPLVWLAAGVVTGLAGGAMGARAKEQPAWWGAPAGVFLGEAIAVVLLRGRVAQAVAEAACAAGCVRLMKGAWKRGLILAAATTPATAAFALYYRLVLYWGRGSLG